MIEDGRPCSTDVFLVALLEQIEDEWDMRQAIKDWIEGDWNGALAGINLPANANNRLAANVDTLVNAASAVAREMKNNRGHVRHSAQVQLYAALAAFK